MHINASFSEKSSAESGEKSAQIKHCLQAKTALHKYVGGFCCERQQEMDFYNGRIFIMSCFFFLKQWFEVKLIVVFLSAVWTLVLTAPIHFRASIAE